MNRSKEIFSLLIVGSILLAAPIRAEEPYSRTKNIVYQEREGVGLVLDTFVPTGKKNGLAIIDTLSG
ncbi:MAG: hypothetical protein KC994_27020, partial [Candidatus Omnitrophica bacterium]|nr:hypothetical protein [Candidatus Omnitrophota bacterium]